MNDRNSPLNDRLPFESDPKKDFQKAFNKDMFVASTSHDPAAATKAVDSLVKNVQRLGSDAQSMDPLGNQFGSEEQLRMFNQDKRIAAVEKMLGSEKMGPAGKEALAEFEKVRADITKGDWAALAKDTQTLQKTMSSLEQNLPKHEHQPASHAKGHEGR